MRAVSARRGGCERCGCERCGCERRGGGGGRSVRAVSARGGGYGGIFAVLRIMRKNLQTINRDGI